MNSLLLFCIADERQMGVFVQNRAVVTCIEPWHWQRLQLITAAAVVRQQLETTGTHRCGSSRWNKSVSYWTVRFLFTCCRQIISSVVSLLNHDAELKLNMSKKLFFLQIKFDDVSIIHLTFDVIEVSAQSGQLGLRHQMFSFLNNLILPRLNAAGDRAPVEWKRHHWARIWPQLFVGRTFRGIQNCSLETTQKLFWSPVDTTNWKRFNQSKVPRSLLKRPVGVKKKLFSTQPYPFEKNSCLMLNFVVERCRFTDTFRALVFTFVIRYLLVT